MAGYAETRTWDVLLTTTLGALERKIVDQITDQYAFTSWLTGGRVSNLLRGVKGSDAYDNREGGESIEVRVWYGLGGTAASRAYTAQTLTTPKDGATLGRFNWKYYSDSIVVFQEELDRNSGDAQVVNLLEFKIKQSTMALRDLFNGDAFGTNGDGGTALNGMGNIVDSAGTAGGLAAATFTWWAADENAASPTSFAANGIEEMRKLWVDLAAIGSTPEIIVTSPSVYTWYEARLFNQTRFIPRNDAMIGADPAFTNAVFHTVPVIFDKDETNNHMFMVNAQSLRLTVLRNKLFKVTPFESSISDGQNAKVALVEASCEMTTPHRRGNGKITGFVA